MVLLCYVLVVSFGLLCFDLFKCFGVVIFVWLLCLVGVWFYEGY